MVNSQTIHSDFILLKTLKVVHKYLLYICEQKLFVVQIRQIDFFEHVNGILTVDTMLLITQVEKFYQLSMIDIQYIFEFTCTHITPIHNNHWSSRSIRIWKVSLRKFHITKFTQANLEEYFRQMNRKLQINRNSSIFTSTWNFTCNSMATNSLLYLNSINVTTSDIDNK